MALLLCTAACESHRLNQRTRSFWLPGFIGLTGACMFFLLADFRCNPSHFFQEISLRPQRIVTYSSDSSHIFYFIWLAAQVAFGASAAFMSRRAGGSRRARILAGALPGTVIVGTYVLLIPVTARFTGGAATSSFAAYLVAAVIVWVMAPAIAVLIGAAPFLREPAIETSLVQH